MKSSILVTSALATGVFAWPKPQLLDLNLGARVTIFATVTVTKPASTCLPASATGVVAGQPSLKTSLSIPSVAPISTAAPTQQSATSKWVFLPQTTSKPVPAVQTSWTPLPQITAKPLPTVNTTPVPVPQVPSPGGRVTGTAQAYLSVGISYQAAILYHHNAARANHGAAPLTWDTSCEANARLAANTCQYARYMPAGVSQGQNLYLTAGDAFNVTAAITEVWYKNEFSSAVPWFGIASLPVTLLANVEHLTQVLWKGSSRVGCASVDCGARMRGGGATASSNKYTVCNYASASNVGGQFAINVGRPVSTTSLGRWTD